ncbi:Transcription repressor OFP4 [Linum grandiflorum]
MGIKPRFRLSDMIPNAWFYKLKDNMSSKPRTTSDKFIKRNKIKKQQPPNFSSNSPSLLSRNTRPPPPSSSQPGCSSYFASKPEKATTDHHKLYNSPVNPKASDTQFPDQPRRSSCSSRRRKAIYKPSPKLPHHIIQYSSSSPFESSSPDFCRTESDDEKVSHYSTNDIIIDVKDRSFELESLLPIVTSRPRKSSTTKKRSIRVKSNSPRLASRKSNKGGGGGRKSVSSHPSPLGRRRSRTFAESFAVVKSSMDPERDFMDSMVEMIVENDIKGSKELEELLACYLSLNLDKYHDVIVRAFEQIWFHMA